jgi:hypothetical protein
MALVIVVIQIRQGSGGEDRSFILGLVSMASLSARSVTLMRSSFKSEKDSLAIYVVVASVEGVFTLITFDVRKRENRRTAPGSFSLNPCRVNRCFIMIPIAAL